MKGAHRLHDAAFHKGENIMTDSNKSYRVTVIEWLSHKAVIEAEGPEQAEAKGRQLWADNAEHAVFAFEDSGIDGVMVDEVRP